MNLSNSLTLNHVATFVAVAEAGSFRGGAERVNISQSAVSVRIQHLEQRLGVALFHRTTRSVELTEPGERLLAVSRRILADFEGIALELRSEALLERGRIVVGAVPSIASHILPVAMAQFQARYQGIEIEIRDIDSGQIVSMLRSAQIDIALISKCAPEEADFMPLFWDEFYVVVSQEAAQTLTEPVALEDAARFPLLLSSTGTTIRRDIDQFLDAMRIEAQVKYEALNTATLIGLAEQGFGAAIVPGAALANTRLRSGTALRLAGNFGRHIGVAIASHRSASPALVAFKAFLEEHMEDWAKRSWT